MAHTERHRIGKRAARHNLTHSAGGHRIPLPLVHTTWNLSPTVHGEVVNKSESLQGTVHRLNPRMTHGWSSQRPRSGPSRTGSAAARCRGSSSATCGPPLVWQALLKRRKFDKWIAAAFDGSLANKAQTGWITK